ncbi:metallophosphoesterase [Sphingobacterium thalpophilum]|uniref:metallophosphoesterase n=1 Tax=Sphingobacterium thalpophilum TaxID=259 RepID=UPI002D77DBC0|nr:metallophosphoesterase [Sphingobacterium thalpophilum]
MVKKLFLIVLVFMLGDIYFFQAVSTVFRSQVIHSIYWWVDLLLVGGVFIVIFLRRSGHDVQHIAGVLISSFLTVFIPKLLALPVLLAEDAVRVLRGFPIRNTYISEMALLWAMLILILIVFGLTKGRHFYRVRQQILYFPDLPEDFDGFRITQLSDIHSGSLSNVKAVKRGIDLVNAQRSDLVLFTGDLVNNKASEMEPWISDFGVLQAPFGKFSVLGNHDYGDYVRWENADSKALNLLRLKDIHHEMGFRLLTNESITIQKGSDSISLIGVENWGKGGFHQYGDLDKATARLPKDSFKILMSHDPSHWEQVTLNHHTHVHLTFAGHTHGMQFGIELFGFKWSPIQYFYEQWAGLYHKDGKYLYVNRGFGYHGLKGRIGIWPEITVITLKRSDQQL